MSSGYLHYVWNRFGLYLTFKYANGITMTQENFGNNNAIRFIGSRGQVDVELTKLETMPATLATQ